MKKLISLLVVAAFALTLVPVAKADQISDLMALITSLQAQIAALQGTATGTTCFATNLKLGMTSADVKLLQTKLGVINTGYFGPLTLAAVKTFQAANGVPNTGFVGILTRAQLNAKFCAATTTPTTATTATTVAGSIGEASLSTTSAPVYVVSNVKGGETGKNIFAFNVKATNANATLNRVDLLIEDGTASTTIFPWRSLKSVSLYDGSTLLKTIDATLMANYNEITFGTDYMIRFEGISDILVKDQAKTLTFVVDVQGTPYRDGTNHVNDDFQFSINLGNSIRATDTAGLTQYATYTGVQNVSLTQNATTATLTLAANSSSPKVGIINAVNTTDALTDKTVFIFDVLSAGTDSTIKTLVLDSVEGTLGEITSGSLYDGSNVIASAAVVDANSDKTGTITFSNLNIALLKDTTKTLTVKINVKPVDGTGAKVADSITIGFNSLVAVDSNYNAPASPAAVAGTAQKLYVKAPVFTFESADAQIKTVNPSSGTETVTGSLHFSVTAQGQDVYITEAAVHATQGVILAQQVADGTPVTTTYTFTQMNITSADADYAAGVYKVASGGTTRHFAASYSITVAGANGYNGAKIDHALWSTNADGITGAVDFGFMMPTAKSGQIAINK